MKISYEDNVFEDFSQFLLISSIFRKTSLSGSWILATKHLS